MFEPQRLWWLRGGMSARVLEALHHEPIPQTADEIVATLAERVPEVAETTARMIAESLLEERGG